MTDLVRFVYYCWMSVRCRFFLPLQQRINARSEETSTRGSHENHALFWMTAVKHARDIENVVKYRNRTLMALVEVWLDFEPG